MDEPYTRAPGFYAAFICSIGIGVGLNCTAVINGVLAPFLFVGILMASSDRRLMHNQPSPLVGRIVVGATTVAMFGAAIGMVVL